MTPEPYTRFRDELASALDPRFYTIEWLDQQIETGALCSIGNDKAVIIFGFEQYPTGWLELQGTAAAGDLATIKDELIPAAEAIGRSIGCGTAEIESREGWARALKVNGYDIFQVKIKKAL